MLQDEDNVFTCLKVIREFWFWSASNSMWTLYEVGNEIVQFNNSEGGQSNAQDETILLKHGVALISLHVTNGH